jgi:hypothetical protein
MSASGERTSLPPNQQGRHLQNRWLTDRSAANIVNDLAAAAGLDARLFAGHSLRSGFLTSAAAKWGIAFQDDGRQPPPFDRDAARLCP